MMLNNFLIEERNTGSVWSNAQVLIREFRRNIRLAEAPSYGQSIFTYAPDSNGAQDYRSLALEVIKQHAGANGVRS